MEVQLPIPYVSDSGSVFDRAELKKPSGGVLADTRETLDRTNEYNAMRIFVSGCTEKIIGESEITDSVAIKSAWNKTSNKTLEYLAVQIMIDYYNSEDFIEGLYFCPRCDTRIIAEKRDEDGMDIDTRDRISDLQVNFMEGIENMKLDVEIDPPVELKSQNTQEMISNIQLRMPCTEDYISAFQTLGSKNLVRIQYFVYGRCILKANGTEVDSTWRRAFGVALFNKIQNTKQVFDAIGKWINGYGMDPSVSKTCPECGKVWDAQIHSSNFFVSALQ